MESHLVCEVIMGQRTFLLLHLWRTEGVPVVAHISGEGNVLSYSDDATIVLIII